VVFARTSANCFARLPIVYISTHIRSIAKVDSQVERVFLIRCKGLILAQGIIHFTSRL
jgi:hypothetical protein